MSRRSETSNNNWEKAFSKRGELLRGKIKLELKKRIVIAYNTVLQINLEYGIVCCRNMDVEEGGYSTTGMV